MAAVVLSPDQAHAAVPQDIRNAIYSALLSGDGIRNIEATLDHHLQTSGFKAALRAYMTDLFRSGQATTAVEARDMAMARIRASSLSAQAVRRGKRWTRSPRHIRVVSALVRLCVNLDAASSDANGPASDAPHDVDLSIPPLAIKEGTKSVRAELEKVVDITYDNDK